MIELSLVAISTNLQVLSVWPVVEAVLNGNDVKASRMQVIRVRTEDDLKIVGMFFEVCILLKEKM